MATALIVDLANDIVAELNSRKAANFFVNGLAAYNSFSVEDSFLPMSKLEAFPANGKVWVVYQDFDMGPNQSRGPTNLTQLTLPIQVAIQWPINSADKTTLKNLVLLVEQIRYVIRKMLPNKWQWLRTESLKSENGTPFNYTGLREGSFFESYSTSFFLVTAGT